MVTFWYQRSRAHHAYASRCEWRTPFRPCASVSRKYSLRSMPADQAAPSPVSTSTPTSSRNSSSLMTRSICRLSFGLMQLRFSGRLNFTHAIPSLTRTATVSASARSLMGVSIAILYNIIAPGTLRRQSPPHAHDRSPGQALRLRPAARLDCGDRRAQCAARAARAAPCGCGHAHVDRVLTRHHPEPRGTRPRHPAGQHGPVRRPPGGARGYGAAAGRRPVPGARSDGPRACAARQGAPCGGRSRGGAARAGAAEAAAHGVADPDSALGPRRAVTLCGASSILEPFARAAVVEHDRLTGHRMRVVERDGIGRRPQPRWRIHECIRSDGVLGVAPLRHGDKIERGFLPPLGEAAVPERVITQRPDLPSIVAAHVVVFVDATLPPCALPAIGRVMQPGLHYRASAYLGRAAVLRDVDDHLQLRVIEQPAVARAVVPLRELLLEALDVQAAHAGLALVDAAEKPHLGVLGEQVDNLVVLRLVDEVAVGVLNAADLVNILLDRKIVLEPFDAGRECGNVAHVEVFLRSGHICMSCSQKAIGTCTPALRAGAEETRMRRPL